MASHRQSQARTQAPRRIRIRRHVRNNTVLHRPPHANGAIRSGSASRRFARRGRSRAIAPTCGGASARARSPLPISLRHRTAGRYACHGARPSRATARCSPAPRPGPPASAREPGARSEAGAGQAPGREEGVPAAAIHGKERPSWISITFRRVSPGESRIHCGNRVCRRRRTPSTITLQAETGGITSCISIGRSARPGCRVHDREQDPRGRPASLVRIASACQDLTGNGRCRSNASHSASDAMGVSR